MADDTVALKGEIHELRNEVRDIKSDVRAVRTLLDGGHRPAEGLIVRLDRLEQRGFGVLKAWWLIVSAVIGAAVSYAVSLVQRL